MNNSQLIVFTYKEPLYCCCFVEESLMACSSNKALILWDFAQGKMISQFHFDDEIAPISVGVIKRNQDRVTLHLQLKQTKIIIFVYDKVGKNIIRVNDYQMEMIGFTKLSLATQHFDSNGNVQKMIDEHFFTIRYSNKIEKRSILSGKIEQQIEIDQTKFEEVNFMLTYTIDNVTYFLVAEEGTTFKQFILGKQSQIIEANNIKSLASQAQVSIVLSIQPIQGFRAYFCMRNEHIYIMNLKDLSIQLQLNFKSYRIIKSIPISKSQKIYAISTKNELCLLSNNKIKSRQKLQKSFIIDIDTFQYGIIGVTQQGKIVYFPII